MKVNFEKVVCPCVMDEVIAWHVSHGWVWDVVEVPTGRRLGVLYCTLLCGDGGVVHFSTVPGIKIPWQTTHAAMRKAMRMIVPVCNVLLATIPADNRALVRCARRLGFLPMTRYFREGREIMLLQYFSRKKSYINAETRVGDNNNFLKKGLQNGFCKKS